jgi:hypothetical protein
VAVTVTVAALAAYVVATVNAVKLFVPLEATVQVGA